MLFLGQMENLTFLLLKLAKNWNLGVSGTRYSLGHRLLSDFADLSEIGPGFSVFPTLFRYEITGLPQSVDALLKGGHFGIFRFEIIISEGY